MDFPLTEDADEIDKSCGKRSTIAGSGTVSNIRAIGTGVLGNDQKFTDTGINETFGLLHNLAGRATDQVTTQLLLNNAKRATTVTALGYPEVGDMPRCRPYILRRDEARIRIVGWRKALMDRPHDLL